MAHLRLFASARQSAGTGHDVFPGSTIDEVLRAAVARFGSDFATVLVTCKIWLNGHEASRSTVVNDADEIALLPPISGGCL